MATPLGLALPATGDPTWIVGLGRRAAAAGIEELWVAEDLGLHGGVALAGAVLAATDGVRVGLGIAPAAARHPAFLAMQAATLGQLYPGRFILGIGHGMPGWMRSLGIWPRSPLTRLEETLVAVRTLLRGDTCHLAGEEVLLQGVALRAAPVSVPVLAGVRGPRSLAVAGRAADGVVLAGYAGPDYISAARAIVDRHRTGPSRVVAAARFALDDADPARPAADRLRDDLGRNLDALGDMVSVDSVAAIDAAVLRTVGITGTLTDLRAGIRTWRDAGADLVVLDPLSPSDLDAALTGLEAGAPQGHR